MSFIGGSGVAKTVSSLLLATVILLASFGAAIAEPEPSSTEKTAKIGEKAAADKPASKSPERKPGAASKTGDSASSAKSSEAKADAEPGPLPELFELAAELQAMVDEDQKARTALIQKMAAAPGAKGGGETAGGETGAENGGGEKSVTATSEVQAAIELVRSIDAKNTIRLKEIVAEHGWPGISKLGKTGSGNMWLLVQHADQQVDFQKKCLELMTPLLERREVSRQNFAYLMDRVLVNTGKPQRYGTQINMKGTEFVPAEVESPEELDARRKDMDLSPMAEYLEQVKAAYGDTAKPADNTKPDAEKSGEKSSDKPTAKP